MVDQGLENVAVYNFGVGSEVSWDQDMANRLCVVYQYDHTIVEPPKVHGAVKYYKLGLAPKTEGEFTSLADAVKFTANNHQADMILNIDIEGAEWDVLPALGDDDLAPFSQIVIELHDLLKFVTDDGFRHTVNDAIARLTADHTIVHVHANNYGQRGIAGQVMGFDVLELTLVRSGEWQFSPFRSSFPSEFDAPNNPDKPEYPLGQFGFLRPITG
jgi:hypothetical protein